MTKKTIVITEADGEYYLENNGISEFALIGILECIVFEMKSAKLIALPAEPEKASVEQKKAVAETKETERENKPEAAKEVEPAESPGGAPELRTRISNAIKAIRGLGGNIEDTDLSRLTDDELRAELEELTSQYKRLKSTKTTKK